MAPPNRAVRDRNRDQVPYRIVAWQSVATAVVTAAFLLLELPGDPDAALGGFIQTASALAAGLASVIPAGLYAWRASVERSATSFLLQGVVKFALTLVLVAGSIIVLKPAAAAFFGTLALMQVMYVAVPLRAGGDGQLPRG